MIELRSSWISILLFYALIVSWQLAWAAGSSGGGKGSGVKVNAAIGSPSVSLLNPDETTAYYSGVSLKGAVEIPFFDRGAFAASLNLLGRYLDLRNTSNSSNQREMGNHIGPGIGLHLGIARFFVGTSYYYLRARHIWVGTNNYYQEFDYSTTTTYYGVAWNPASQATISLSYETSQATIASAQINLSRDVPYSDNTIWLHLTYSTGTSLGAILQALFK